MNGSSGFAVEILFRETRSGGALIYVILRGNGSSQADQPTPGGGAALKVCAVEPNNRKRSFEVTTEHGQMSFPYVKADPAPTSEDPLTDLFVDDELAREGFTYRLASGREGSVHVEQVLDYNEDPGYLRDQLLYRLTVEALRAIEETPLSRREIIRRLGTSPAQLYRLLDTTNYRKSVDQLLLLLQVLDRDVDLVVREKDGV